MTRDLPQPTPRPWLCSFALAFHTWPNWTGVPQGTMGPLRPVGSHIRLLAAVIPGPSDRHSWRRCRCPFRESRRTNHPQD